MRGVLEITTSKSCGVTLFRGADTPIFGRAHEIHSMDIVFQEGYIAIFFFNESESAVLCSFFLTSKFNRGLQRIGGLHSCENTPLEAIFCVEFVF